ncbi:MAG: sugar ABC transporter ATP-binding protein [Thermoprotei archaeon]|nr:MAG: sugar ABC transporter ATP-binding protein [Thermoprotei archaeon]
MADVRLVHVTKVFRSGKRAVVAVDDLTLDIKDKEFFVLLGPSGCGKTTTLRLIAGLEVPTKGEIYIGGELVNDIPPKDRDVAMVFQSYALYPHMKVFDNIAFPLKLRKMPKREIERRVKEVAKMLHIEHLLDRKPAELSGGERQRVALARAIVRRPKVFLMDEPLSNLDAKLRVMARAYLKRLQRELEVTTIYVTHDQVEAMTMADRIAVMNIGRLQQVGTPNELYNKPANLFVAGFIGSPPMNFVEGVLREIEGKLFFDAKYFKIPLPSDIEEILRGQAPSEEVILGVRPEDMRISLEKVPEGIRGRIYVLEPLGTRTIVNVELGPELIVKVEGPREVDLRIGQEIWLTLDYNRIHFFDKKTEKAIL